MGHWHRAERTEEKTVTTEGGSVERRSQQSVPTTEDHIHTSDSISPHTEPQTDALNSPLTWHPYPIPVQVNRH
jgi:hypothetical protein